MKLGQEEAKGTAFVLRSTALPYGYTVCLWSSGAMLIHFRQTPNVGAVFLFIAGALIGFTLIFLLDRNRSASFGEVTVLTGALHWLSIGTSVGLVVAVAQIPNIMAWFIGSFIATVGYLGLAGLELLLGRYILKLGQK